MHERSCCEQFHASDIDDLYDLFPLGDVDLSGQIDRVLSCMIRLMLPRWEPYSLRGQGCVS